MTQNFERQVARGGLVGRVLPADHSGELLDAANGLRNELRHLHERWEHGLAFNNADLVEKYFRGGFSITLDFDFAGAAEEIDPSSCSDVGISGYRVAVCITRTQVGNAAGHQERHQEPVLVPVVELIQDPEQAIPSFVRAYLVKDEFANAGNGLLYGSVSAFARSSTTSCTSGLSIGQKGSFKFLPRFGHREGDACIAPSHQLRDGVIERGLEAVDDIASQHSELGWYNLGRGDTNKLAAFRLILDRDSAEIRLQEGFPLGLQLVDVLVGPY